MATETGSIAHELGTQYQKLFETTSLVVEDANGAAGGAPTARAEVLVIPKGREVVSVKKFLDEYRTAPERRKGTATLGDADSFIALANRFKDDGTVVYQDPSRTAPRFTVVFDYHRAGPHDDAAPRWGQHRAVYAPPLSEEWRAWQAAHGQWMTGQAFAEFLDLRLPDVVAAPGELPESLREWAETVGGRFGTPGALLAVSRNFSVNVETAVRQATTLDSGEVSIIYDEQHKDGAGAPVRVPNLFLVGVPVFVGGPRWTLPVRLRYRVAQAKVLWAVALHNAQAVFDQAVAEVAERVRAETDLPLYVGSPEA